MHKIEFKKLGWQRSYSLFKVEGEAHVAAIYYWEDLFKEITSAK
jgi:hypothetical protein